VRLLCLSNCHVYVYSYAESIGASLFVTSAKAETGIDDVFSDIAKRMFLFILYISQGYQRLAVVVAIVLPPVESQ
jgi:hypothetical protein